MTDLPAREAMEFDVVIVGAGPAGLAAAIRLKQINPDIARRGRREGLRGRRPYPLRRGDRSDRPRPTAAGLARRGHAAQDRRSPTTASIGSRPIGAHPAAEFRHAAADEQPRQLHRLARQCLPLARAPRRRRSASRSIRALPPPKCSIDDNGAVAGIATGDMGVGKDGEPQGLASPAAWSCAANTRCSPKARAARSASSSSPSSTSTTAASRRNSASA